VRDPESGRDISAHQASILDHLDEVDPLSTTALAEHMGVTVATTSLAVDRLERRKYVRRAGAALPVDRAKALDGLALLARASAAHMRAAARKGHV
jgi:DNA-binding IclR family transcriptional regulator